MRDSKQHPGANPTETIIVDCDLDEAPEKVWRALTEPALLAAWLMPNDIRPEVGHRFTLRAAPGTFEHGRGGDIACKVEAVEPHRLLRFSWRGDERERDAAGGPLDSTVTFALSPTRTGGTHLRLIHSGLPLSHRLATRLGGAGSAISMLLSPLRLAA
jgi:uncharacterized protein YndB with AHSA1/START domain